MGSFEGMAIFLELDLTSGVLDDAPSDPVERLLARRRVVLRQLIDRLTDAAGDHRVVRLHAKLGAPGLSLAQVQDLRATIVAFRRTGKPAIAWSETFGELGRGTGAYVLATGFDEIWLQPSGSVGLVGTAVTSVFVRDALDRARLEPLFRQRYEYKNAADSLLRRELSAPHREAVQRLATSAFEQVVAAVAEGRQLPEDQVRALIDEAPIPARDALASGLVDHLGYRDEVLEAIDRRGRGRRADLLYLSRYRPRQAARRRLGQARRPGIGVVHITGAIRQGRSARAAIGRSSGSDTVAAAIRAAAADDRLGAIVLCVNSPGGSYVASDTIWREVCHARTAGKVVVASMGGVAASGGYYVAMASDVILAQPATLTGSIGVLAGKLQASGLLDHAGAHVESVSMGRHAQMFSPQTGFSDEEWAKLDAWLDGVYTDFTTKVSQGRGMSLDAVHEVARGRVWTGADALERGLVDELGGLRRAVDIARERANLPADAPVRPVPSISLARRLRRPRNSDDSTALAAIRTAGGHLAGWGDLAGLAASLGLPAAGPLTMPEVRLTV